MDREKVIEYAEETLTHVLPDEKDTSGIMVRVGWIRDALAMLNEQNGLMLALEQSNAVNRYLNAEVERLNGLLKEQEEQKRKWLQTIADTQLAISPTGYESEDELAKRGWEWNGLQMAWEIIAGEERSEHPRLVRCKDCKHHGEWSCAVCINELFETAGDWFCADGEAGEANDKLFQEDIWHK